MLVVLVVALGISPPSRVYGWIEAGWLRERVLEVPLDGLPEALDGVRIGHLSDFHLGAPLSRGNRASERAATWVAERRPDLVCITGDLVSHPRGEPRLRELLARLDDPFVVLGNHDVAVTRDPFSRAAELHDLERARLLGDEAETVMLRGELVSVVGVDPETYRAKRARPHELADPGAALRLLLCHFPRVVERVPPSSFDLILAGHLHAGQICVPLPGRRVTLAHPRAELVSGLYQTTAGIDARVSGHGHDLRPFPVLRPARGDGARLRRRD